MSSKSFNTLPVLGGANAQAVEPDYEPAATILDRTFNVGTDDDGVPVFIWQTSDGKGSGLQMVLAAESERFGDELEARIVGAEGKGTTGPSWVRMAESYKLRPNPGPRRGTNGILPAPYQGRDFHQINLSVGLGKESKGNKPTKIPLGEEAAVIAMWRKKCAEGLALLKEHGFQVEQEGLTSDAEVIETQAAYIQALREQIEGLGAEPVALESVMESTEEVDETGEDVDLGSLFDDEGEETD